MSGPGSYPFATGEGRPVPFDIIRPNSLGLINFTSTPSGVIPIGVEDEVAVLYSTQDCLVRFGSAVSVPASENEIQDTTLILSGVLTTVQYTADGISVVRLSTNGTLYILRVTNWQLARSGLASNRR